MANEKYCPEHSGVCRRVEALVREIELRFSGLERSIRNTKQDLDIRLEAMNEFRAQLDRQANTFVPRQEINLALSKLEEKLDTLIKNSAEQRGSTKWIDHIITVLIGLVVVIIVAYFSG